ncbi:hypothetical protein ABL78_3516 [Leptomonas seymouri]|uniref:Uncharacterized protein n=1 Tax=Leptomonas seymouri TaxID=5684 RepID=A0A0N1HZG9_LEPSE|nr:hypothetical protein ABL78_3516 [Leptomonas seymouri]|eukprot:KPI87432.1 hypothetical protein ABL78_3516 [Leptomonas seymouri]
MVHGKQPHVIGALKIRKGVFASLHLLIAKRRTRLRLLCFHRNVLHRLARRFGAVPRDGEVAKEVSWDSAEKQLLECGERVILLLHKTLPAAVFFDDRVAQSVEVQPRVATRFLKVLTEAALNSIEPLPQLPLLVAHFLKGGVREGAGRAVCAEGHGARRHGGEPHRRLLLVQGERARVREGGGPIPGRLLVGDHDGSNMKHVLKGYLRLRLDLPPVAHLFSLYIKQPLGKRRHSRRQLRIALRKARRDQRHRLNIC